MAAFESFSHEIEARLAAARREPHWEPAETARFMAELAPRRRLFEDLAPRLVRSIIRPRVEALASFFPNARLDRAEHDDRCACWFGYCERFPANTKVEIAVEHDERIENLVIHYELYIMPVFLKFDPHDKLVIPLAGVDDQAIGQWVETKLLAFLDTYLRLDRGADDFEDEVVVDPVCGMRISRSSAGTQMDYHGHPYYFCSSDCRQRFAQDPLRYVKFEIG
jgi:YHS domain-containing protein